MRRQTPFLILLLLALVLPAAARAVQPVRGELVALGTDFLVIDPDEGGRRLFVLDQAPAPADLVPGQQVAVRFVVGEDQQLHAVAVERVAPAAPPVAGRARLGALLALAGFGPPGAMVAILLLATG